jgi:ubiquinol-cytochrome c reductase iron-sulfur subunit
VTPSRFAAGCLALAALASLGLTVVYVQGGQPQLEGALLAVSLCGIGAALMAWSKYLMANIAEETQERHIGAPSESEARSAEETVGSGMREIGRRTLLTRLLVGAAGMLGIAALFPIRSLGRAPRAALDRTSWRPGARLVTIDGEAVREDTLDIGSFTTVFPEGFPGSADAQAVLVRVAPDELQLPPDRAAGAPDGLVAYSKLCTHAGCPVGLYLAATHELRCPCHQSTFDVLDGAKPVYGPAPKPLPQLPIEIGQDRVLRATGDFTAPVGPSYWNVPPGKGP